MNLQDLQTHIILDLDHPGAQDQEYRQRRNEIAELSNNFWEKTSSSGFVHIPQVEYLPNEQKTWQTVNLMLSELLDKNACSSYLKARQILSLPLSKIPQMADLTEALKKLHGFKLFPIAGLVNSKAFLSGLAQKTMLCTQYIRHHSRPTFTPEPDLIHEYIGHAPMFTDQAIVEFSELIGQGALRATPDQLTQLERLYWFTLEYGLIEENGKVKAFGAGLLAGIEDHNNAFKSGADLRPFDLNTVINTPYDYAHLQDKYFVLQSFDQLREATRLLISAFQGN